MELWKEKVKNTTDGDLFWPVFCFGFGMTLVYQFELKKMEERDVEMEKWYLCLRDDGKRFDILKEMYDIALSKMVKDVDENVK